MPDGQPDLRDVVDGARTVAVVGASDNPARPSNDVFGYLARRSHYVLYPVNPNVAEVCGVRAYPRLADLPEVPDMVDAFRRREELPALLEEILALPGRPKYLWLQSGLRHDEVAAAAREAGIQVVQDRCLKVDYARLRG